MGWLKFRPGERDSFLRAQRSYVDACRAEPGCLFFDMPVDPFDSDTAMVMECFASEEAHAEHLTRSHFHEFWAALGKVCLEGTFQNILSDEVTPDTAKFA